MEYKYFIEDKGTGLWWYAIWGNERMIHSFSGRPSGQTIPIIEDGWTNDPLKADDFLSKEKAQKFIEVRMFQENVFISEHEFIDPQPMTTDNNTNKPTPQEFLRDKYKLVDFHDLTLNGKSWLEIMEEYRLTFDESDRANYYEDKIDMLNRHLQQRDEELRDLHWHKKAYQKHIDDLVRRLYPTK